MSNVNANYQLWQTLFGNAPTCQVMKINIPRSVGKSQSMLKSFTIYDEISPYYIFGKEDYLEVSQQQSSSKTVFKILWLNKKDTSKRIDATKRLYHSVDIKVDEFHKVLRTKFNAISKNHHSYIFRSKEDAEDAKAWMESLLVEEKLKKSK